MLIDFRARPNTAEYLAIASPADKRMSDFRWGRWGVPVPKPQPLSGFIDDMDRLGIAIAVFTGRQRVVEGKLVFGITNDYVAECVQAYPDRLIGFAGVDMSSGAAAAREVERAVKEFGFRGVSLDPRMTGTMPNDRKKVYPIYEKAQELGVPVVFTLGPVAGSFSDPNSFDEPAGDFPDLNFVCSHSVWPEVTGYLALAYRRWNVYLEPSIYFSLPGTQLQFESANGWLADRMIYASAYPFARLDAFTEMRARLEWDEKAWQQFTHLNAARLLQLDEKPLMRKRGNEAS